jgi:hypothetical protein
LLSVVREVLNFSGRPPPLGNFGSWLPFLNALRCVIEWLNQHPASSAPGRCAWCGKAESRGAGAVVLPFETQPGTHGPSGIKRGGRARLRRFVPRAFEHEDAVMSQKKSAIDKKVRTVVANDPDDPDPARARRRGDRVSKTPRVHHDAR